LGGGSSLEQAKNAKEKLFSLPGFKDYTSDSFYIDPYEVDEVHWQETDGMTLEVVDVTGNIREKTRGIML
jgi:hypothetical protein